MSGRLGLPLQATGPSGTPVGHSDRAKALAPFAYNGHVSALSPTPPEHLVDPQGRPYFLWDIDLTLEEFRDRLNDADIDVRACFIAKLMRQAKPDDVFTFVSPRTIRAHWARIEHRLGRTRDFWVWLFASWERLGHVWR